MKPPVLCSVATLRTRFGETDAMGVVWHGSYVQYLEDGREAFGAEFGLSYSEVYANGYFTPLVDLQLKYLQALQHNQSLRIETTFLYSPAAKIQFSYQLFQADSNVPVLKAQSTQVFLRADSRQLEITNPPFFEQWKTRWGFGQ